MSSPGTLAEEGTPITVLGLRPRGVVLVSAATIAVGLVVAPQTLAAGPVLCPLRRLTGIPCPGCGLTRACAACLHGDLAQSIHYHPFGLLVCAAAAAALVLFAVGVTTGTRPLDGAMLAVRRRPTLRVAGVLALSAWLAWAACRAAAFLVGGVAWSVAL